MTYDPVDTDDDGTVETDIDNTNTTTQTLDTGRLITDQGLFIEEDDNSPIKIESSTGGQISLNQTYDRVEVVFGSSVNFQINDVDMQVNGITSGYNYVESDDTQKGPKSQWPLRLQDQYLPATTVVVGHSEGGNIVLSTPISGDKSTQTVGGFVTGSTNGIDSLRFFNNASESISVEAHIIGYGTV